MAKPKIILADTDINYMMTLQLKIVKDFFDAVDLEIITDREYFEQYFRVPQKAAVLILSEDLYQASLLKHNISYIFLLTEQPEEEKTENLAITKIYKYTSISEIFKVILGKSASVLNRGEQASKNPQLILVTAASGGVGKTTVAMGISGSLAKNYKKVLYINADQLQTFQNLLVNESPISNLDVYAKLMRSTDNAYYELKYLVRTETFSYVPPFKAALMSIGLSTDVFISLAISAKRSGDFDYIVVDTDSVFDDKKADLLNEADKVVFVTKQNRMSVCATNLLIANISNVKSEKYLYICNDFNKEADNALVSPEISPAFSVDEYIWHMANYDRLKGSDFADDINFQKLCYLFV